MKHQAKGNLSNTITQMSLKSHTFTCTYTKDGNSIMEYMCDSILSTGCSTSSTHPHNMCENRQWNSKICGHTYIPKITSEYPIPLQYSSSTKCIVKDCLIFTNSNNTITTHYNTSIYYYTKCTTKMHY